MTAFCEWVLGPSRSAGIPFIRTELSGRTGALLARNPGTATTAPASPFSTSAAGNSPGPATGASSSAGSAAIDEPAALLDGRPLSGRRRRRRSTPAARCRPSSTSRPARARPLVVLLGQASSQEEADRLVAHYRSVDPDDGAGARPRSAGANFSARCRWKLPIPPSTSCSTAGSSIRPWPAGSGRVRASTRRAAPTAFATSSRIPWRSC